jgi:subtilase family serine protease
MKNIIITTGLILTLVVVAAFAITTTTADPDSKGKPPSDWSAHPPIHIRGAQTSAPTGLSPAQIQHAYGFDNLACSYTSGTWPNASLCGNGQTIAIVDAYNDPNIANDLTTFSTKFNLPPCPTNSCLFIQQPQGKPRNDPGWALEISLDVEWAHAIAPGAKILLVEAKTNSFSNLLGAVDSAAKYPGVHQVSMSWGGSEFSSEASYDYYFQKPGVSFFASSGDSGSGVIWPAASPYVVSVGGTTLNVDTFGNVQSETAWSGSGGGKSCCESEPSYQSGFPMPSTGGKRGVPDVSYDADPNTGFPVYDSSSYGGGWFQVGGTSAGAPQWNALFAIVNSGRSSNVSSISFGTDTLLYNAATGASYGLDYRDITSGSNGFGAGTGYDFVTGLGSPQANNLVPYLKTH